MSWHVDVTAPAYMEVRRMTAGEAGEEFGYEGYDADDEPVLAFVTPGNQHAFILDMPREGEAFVLCDLSDQLRALYRVAMADAKARRQAAL